MREIQHDRVGLSRWPGTVELEEETGEVQADRLDRPAVGCIAWMLDGPGIDGEAMSRSQVARAIFLGQQAVECGKTRGG